MDDMTVQDMVEYVSWFSPIDYEILTFFENHDIEASPKVIAVNIDYDRQYTSKRCRELEKNRILEKRQSGLYYLSETGSKLVSGEIDPVDLEDTVD